MISCHKLCHHQGLLQRRADVLLIWMPVGAPGPRKTPGKIAKTNRAKRSEQFNVTGTTNSYLPILQCSQTNRETEYRFLATLQHTENISDSLIRQRHPVKVLLADVLHRFKVGLIHWILKEASGFPLFQEKVLFSWTVSLPPVFFWPHLLHK